MFWVLLLTEVALGTLAALANFTNRPTSIVASDLLVFWALAALGTLIAGLVLLIRAGRALRAAQRRATALATTAPPPAGQPPQTRKP